MSCYKICKLRKTDLSYVVVIHTPRVVVTINSYLHVVPGVTQHKNKSVTALSHKYV